MKKLRIPEEVMEYFRKIGFMGGEARAANTRRRSFPGGARRADGLRVAGRSRPRKTSKVQVTK